MREKLDEIMKNGEDDFTLSQRPQLIYPPAPSSSCSRSHVHLCSLKSSFENPFGVKKSGEKVKGEKEKGDMDSDVSVETLGRYKSWLDEDLIKREGEEARQEKHKIKHKTKKELMTEWVRKRRDMESLRSRAEDLARQVEAGKVAAAELTKKLHGLELRGKSLDGEHEDGKQVLDHKAEHRESIFIRCVPRKIDNDYGMGFKKRTERYVVELPKAPAEREATLHESNSTRASQGHLNHARRKISPAPVKKNRNEEDFGTKAVDGFAPSKIPSPGKSKYEPSKLGNFEYRQASERELGEKKKIRLVPADAHTIPTHRENTTTSTTSSTSVLKNAVTSEKQLLVKVKGLELKNIEGKEKWVDCGGKAPPATIAPSIIQATPSSSSHIIPSRKPSSRERLENLFPDKPGFADWVRSGQEKGGVFAIMTEKGSTWYAGDGHKISAEEAQSLIEKKKPSAVDPSATVYHDAAASTASSTGATDGSIEHNAIDECFNELKISEYPGYPPDFVRSMTTNSNRAGNKCKDEYFKNKAAASASIYHDALEKQSPPKQPPTSVTDINTKRGDPAILVKEGESSIGVNEFGSPTLLRPNSSQNQSKKVVQNPYAANFMASLPSAANGTNTK